MRALARALSFAAALFCLVPAFAQERFPAQPIELIVPWGTGGNFDITARKLAPILASVLGVAIEVVNVPGATGNAGLTRMLMNPADGYTMTAVGPSTMASWELGTGYARIENLRILAFVTEAPAMLFVRSDSPFNTFQELLDRAKSDPDTLRVSSWGLGTPDISLRILANQGNRFVNLAFAKAEQRIGAVMGRRADVLYDLPIGVMELVRSGQLRPLVVFDVRRHPDFPDVPSVGELGLESTALLVYISIVVSANTPADRADALAAGIAKALDSPAWREYCSAARNCARKYTPDEIEAKLQALRETARRHSSAASR